MSDKMYMIGMPLKIAVLSFLAPDGQHNDPNAYELGQDECWIIKNFEQLSW